jgi:hypothetical protein
MVERWEANRVSQESHFCEMIKGIMMVKPL